MKGERTLSSVKTNAMRVLDKAGIAYKTYSYDCSDGLIDGISAAMKIDKAPELVYKTLVTQGASREYYVFVIPVGKELNLKAAAKAVGEKYVEMIKVTAINNITGYVRGGCSPIGMKKLYKTVIDASCHQLETLIFSAGKIGYQIELCPEDLIKLINCTTYSLTD
jgi:Cys-tRNA(Pro)/Cys-tRNA(Cys) deacylase